MITYNCNLVVRTPCYGHGDLGLNPKILIFKNLQGGKNIKKSKNKQKYHGADRPANQWAYVRQTRASIFVAHLSCRLTQSVPFICGLLQIGLACIPANGYIVSCNGL